MCSATLTVMQCCWLWHVVAVGKWLLHDDTATKISEFTYSLKGKNAGYMCRGN